MLSVCFVITLFSFECLKKIFIKLSMCIMTPEPVSTAYFVIPSHQSVSVYVSPFRC
jgi:hypothetical protein